MVGEGHCLTALATVTSKDAHENWHTGGNVKQAYKLYYKAPSSLDLPASNHLSTYPYCT